MMEPSVAEASRIDAIPDAESGAVRLPCDFLRTPTSGFEAADVSLSTPIQVGQLTDAQLTTYAATATFAFMYRVSGYQNLALLLCDTLDHQSRSRQLEVDVVGASTLRSISAQVSTALQHARRAATNTGVVTLAVTSPRTHQPEDTVEETNQSDLQIHVRAMGDSVTLSMRYNARLYQEKTVELFLACFGNIYESAISENDLTLSQLDVLGKAHREWLLSVCDGPALSVPFSPVYESIEAHAVARPDYPAVRYRERTLSYKKLNEQANQLSHALIDAGIRAGDHVAVCINPSEQIAVSLLAIHKAGGVYVPINPAFPELRISDILDDTAPTLIITDTDVTDLIDFGQRQTFSLTKNRPIVDVSSVANPERKITADDVAYIYYTSGTTGRPKGVVSTHANMAHMINVSREVYRILPDDVIPAVASFTFSISMFELMSPLSVGGTLLVLDRDHVLSPDAMVRTLQEVTVFHIGPSLLKVIVRQILDSVDDLSVYDHVRHASAGGDTIPPELLEQLQSIFGNAEVFVIYGCSEVALMGCTYLAPSDVKKTYVGTVFPNMALRLLDGDGNQVPVGVHGEVCFGGDGIVKGYLNRDDLNAERFFDIDGKRFYRLGDIGKLNHDGELELLGRSDFQVQVRGMRVEPAEIEFHLSRMDGIKEGVVTARQMVSGEQSLVAYYVPVVAPGPGAGMIQKHLAARLPDYMVPSYFVELDALPLNANMKLDRNALPDVAPKASDESRQPTTPTEVSLAKIWRELLKTDNVGLDDNFLMLGGDSLLAMTMIMQVQNELGFTLDGMDVLRETLQVLATICDGGSPANEEVASGEVRADKPFVRSINPIVSKYFGPGDSLYGVLHKSAGQASQPPVVICPPLGHEYTRTRFMLRRIAEELASAGTPALRFDYFGTGNSLGRDVDATLSRWEDDVRYACEYAMAASGADSVRIVAARVGALFALKATQMNAVKFSVFWDPVVDGGQFVEEQAAIHTSLAWRLMAIRNFNWPRPGKGRVEVGGMTMTNALVDAIRLHRGDSGLAADRIHHVISRGYREDTRFFPTWRNSFADSQASFVDDDCNWDDSREAITAITGTKTKDAIVSLIQGEAS